MKTILTSLTALLLIAGSAPADCVFGAKAKTKFKVLNTHTILFMGGYGADFIVKVSTVVTSLSDIAILKDDFCSFENAVLYIDGSVEDVLSVTKL